MSEGHAVTEGGVGLPPPARSSAGRIGSWDERVRLVIVVLLAGLVAVAALLPPAAPGGDRGLSVAGQRLPEVCSLYRTTGLPCPGCGLTRSWVSALHGDLGASWLHHPLGWLVLLYALAQIARHVAWLALPRRRRSVERIGRPLDRGLIALAVLLFVAWIPRVVAAFRTL